MKTTLQEFLFAPVNARALAWFRIALGLIIPWFFWSDGLLFTTRAPDWLRHGPWDFLLEFPYWAFITCLSILLIWGWKTRAIATLLFITLLPLGYLNEGAQSRQVLLFTILAFSFLKSDAIRSPWKYNSPSAPLSVSPCWPIRLIQLQLTLLYGVNALKKSSPEYLSGDALMAMSAVLTNFKVDLTSGFLVIFGLSIPVIIPAIASTLSEYFIALGFWFMKRKWIVALFGIVFHLALTQIIQIFKLDLVSIFLYLAFLLPLINGRR
ncbi:hypothetical protein NT6N_27120 [Oceaniferula spumae]|uniref:HTTM-like domain-containing protein n=1 Tax=Oceaniferula spumae TaxID=2979115 RepID=A0AAT9FNH3_9BACT